MDGGDYVKTSILLVGLHYEGPYMENVIIETRGLCRTEVCRTKSAAPLYAYDIIIIYPRSYSHFIFGEETEYSQSQNELWDLKKENNMYDLDSAFDKYDRIAELEAALKNGTRIIWLLTPDKYVNFFGKRSLWFGYVCSKLEQELKLFTLHEKSSKLINSISPNPFRDYFEQLRLDGWNLCWNYHGKDRLTDIALTPEGYSLGAEITIENNKGWILTPPTSPTSLRELINSALKITKSNVQSKLYNGIFLSHSHEDKPFVLRLRDSLLDKGVKNVWVDEAEINIGDSLIYKIQEGIEKTEYFGIVLSPRSANSSWVQKELQIAMNYEIGSRSVKVLPLLIEPCKLPPFIEGKMYADFTEKGNYDEQLGKLLRRLEKKLINY